MSDRPNIIYLHSHDTGRYVQPYGYHVLTPNIQLLADQGILFRNAFSAASSCSGSRASFVTGQYPHSNGMIGLAHRGFRLFDYSHHIVNTLRRGGYWSALIGEQHITENEDTAVLGYDLVSEVPRTNVDIVAPAAVELLRSGIQEPFFLSVGFFETHRSYFDPSSVRDTLYSQPPTNLPDTIETRYDMAAFKASARSLDHGVGAVLMALVAAGLSDRTTIVFTTDHGLAFPGAKATLTDRGIGVNLIVRGPNGFGGGKVEDALVSQIDLYPTFCELAGVETPAFAEGTSLMPLVRGEAAAVRDEVFAELTYHAAYEPQRAVRTQRYKYIRYWNDGGPVLANVDDSPTKDLMIDLGWADRPVDREQLYDLPLDPNEMRNVAEETAYADVRRQLSDRLDAWMRATGDPLLEGDVPAPAGARINTREQRSAAEPPVVVGADDPLAAVPR
ncbi:MAG: N-sulfoglucosamine sulfohydrolase [Thermoleophilaceae bacterium]|nr:N-sulfoglucosamine sulfohydrolase [Thermoleophilaceae bacterium]